MRGQPLSVFALYLFSFSDIMSVHTAIIPTRMTVLCGTANRTGGIICWLLIILVNLSNCRRQLFSLTAYRENERFCAAANFVNNYKRSREMLQKRRFSSENPFRISQKHPFDLIFCDPPILKKRQKAFKQISVAKTAVLPKILQVAQIHRKRHL